MAKISLNDYVIQRRKRDGYVDLIGNYIRPDGSYVNPEDICQVLKKKITEADNLEDFFFEALNFIHLCSLYDLCDDSIINECIHLIIESDELFNFVSIWEKYREYINDDYDDFMIGSMILDLGKKTMNHQFMAKVKNADLFDNTLIDELDNDDEIRMANLALLGVEEVYWDKDLSNRSSAIIFTYAMHGGNTAVINEFITKLSDCQNYLISNALLVESEEFLELIANKYLEMGAFSAFKSLILDFKLIRQETTPDDHPIIILSKKYKSIVETEESLRSYLFNKSNNTAYHRLIADMDNDITKLQEEKRKHVGRSDFLYRFSTLMEEQSKHSDPENKVFEYEMVKILIKYPKIKAILMGDL